MREGFDLFVFGVPDDLLGRCREAMRLFESLNCCLCKSPFVPIANQPKSPRLLACGKAICHECFGAEEALDKDKQKHRCDNSFHCFSNSNFAYYLIDILSEVTLFRSPSQSGYLLYKVLNPPECPICHEEFSTEGKNRPTPLACLHNICWECFEKCRKPNEGNQKGKYAFRVTCSLCDKNTITNRMAAFRYNFSEFLEELPEMCRQLEQMKNTSFRFCEDCKSLECFERMLDCDRCKKQICAMCALKKHSGLNHNVSELLEKEASHLLDARVISSFKKVAVFRGIFSELTREINVDQKIFEQKFVSKASMLTRKRTLEELQKCDDECELLENDFETFSREYMPHLKRYKTELEGLIKRLEKDPD